MRNDVDYGNIVESQDEMRECHFVRFYEANIVEAGKEKLVANRVNIYNELIYVEDGLARIIINSKPLILKKESMVFVKPTQNLAVQALEQTKFYIVKFFMFNQKGKMQDILLGKKVEPSDQIMNDKSPNLKKIIKEIVVEDSKTNNKNKQKKIDALILFAVNNIRHMLEIDSFSDKKKQHGKEKLYVIDKTISFILDNIYNNISIDDIAKEVNVSSDYISHIFKEVTGVSLINFSQECKIEESKMLLKETDFLIKDIALSLKFYDVSHFYRQFKKRTGMTPGKYRDVIKK